MKNLSMRTFNIDTLKDLGDDVRVFADLDGTYFDFYGDKECLTKMFQKGYFANLKVHLKMQETLKKIQSIIGKENCYVLSKLIDSEHCAPDKRIAIQAANLQIPEKNIIFVPYEDKKIDYIPGGVKKTDILIDDYNENLFEWIEAGGTAIKAINQINNHSGRWKGEILFCDYSYPNFNLATN